MNVSVIFSRQLTIIIKFRRKQFKHILYDYNRHHRSIFFFFSRLKLLGNQLFTVFLFMDERNEFYYRIYYIDIFLNFYIRKSE